VRCAASELLLVESVFEPTHHGTVSSYTEEEDSSTGEIIVRNQILSKYPEIAIRSRQQTR
jgi:hypothetical protein